MRVAIALVAFLIAVAGAGCGNEEAAPAAPAAPTSPTDTVAAGLPAPAAETREGILAAAEAGDYERLRGLIEKKVFLSDYGFGAGQPDPVSAWEKLGRRPLETMGALLQMRHFVRETNEGTLYQWPRLDPDSSADDMTPEERELFRSFMSEAELVGAFDPEYGYTAPRLGILADGTWWFLVLEPGP
jgi:hypothetical protein